MDLYGSTSVHFAPFNQFTEDRPGGGLQGRYFISPHFAIGLGLNRVRQTYQALVVGERGEVVGTIKEKVLITPLTGSVEYFFTPKGVRPYAGIKAGAYFLKGVSLSNMNNARETFFAIAPKIGLQIPLPMNFAVFLETEYNYFLPKEDWLTRKYLQFNLGAAYTIGKK